MAIILAFNCTRAHRIIRTHTFVEGVFSAKPGTVLRRVVYSFVIRVLDMGRAMYVCTVCSEHFTRKYSAKRHIITVHPNNGGKIVTLVHYVVGLKSGLYQPSHPFWYRRNGKRTHKLGRPTVADYVGDAFPHRGLQRQGQYQQHQQSLEEQERYYRQQQEQSLSPSIPLSPSAAIQDQPPDILLYPPDRISEPMDTSNGEGTLSQETLLKIQVFKK
jgi:hypothetical protein